MTTAGLEVGFATETITPDVPVQLAGFAEDQPAAEVHDELEVRAVVMRGAGSAGSAVCLLVFDLLGMSRGFATPVRDAVAAALGTDRDAVLTSCVHTHAGPGTIEGGERLGWHTPDGYGEVLVARSVEAAGAAAARAAPASLRAGRLRLPEGLSVNRRGHPYAPTFSVVDVVGFDGVRLGVIANVSIHPVVLGPECRSVSSDWVGAFRRELEARAGGAAVLVSGALGDVNPRHVHRQGNDCAADPFSEADALGADVAAAVAAALDGTEALPGSDEGPVVSRARRLDVTLGPTLLAGAHGGRHASIELVEWTLGALRIVSVPGEAFHALGRDVDARVEAGGQATLLVGLAPEWRGYLPCPYTEGYEESMSYGSDAVAAIARALTS